MKNLKNQLRLVNRNLKNFQKILSESIRGIEYDYTSGSLKKGITLLAIPMILEMGMESLFAVVDIFFVSKLGSDAIAVVGFTEAVITLIYAVAIGFGMGITAIIARRIGEKAHKQAAIAAIQAIIIGVSISITIGLFGFFFADQILTLMGASSNVVAVGEKYTQLMIGGNGTFVFLFVLAAIFRGAGNPFIAMRALWIANGINIILDPCFIFGWGPFPELGVTGAAVATNIGRFVGVLYMFYHLFKGEAQIKIVLSQIRVHWSTLIGLLKVSLGGIMQFLIATASWVFLMRIVAEFGSEHVAGYTVAMRICMFTFLPAWGLSNAAATLVGQNLGASRLDRAEKSVWLTAKYNLLFMFTAAVVTLMFLENLLLFFISEPNALQVGKTVLFVVALGYPFFGLGMVFTQAFNGSGDTITPTKINFVCFWLIQIPLAWFTANCLDFETLGVAISVSIGESLVALIAWWLFLQGKWKTIKA